jgi:hypothetical protein
MRRNPNPLLQVPGTLMVTFAALSSVQAQDNSYTTSWIGNTWGRANMEWVQNQVLDMCTMPDGTCFTQSMWDECAREGGVYKDGDVLQSYDFDIHRYGGGKAVTANGTYVWHAVAWNKGHIKRVKYSDGKPAPFTGGGGHNADVLQNAGSDCISGLASTASKLFASDSGSQKIKVYDTETMTFIQEWAVPRPGQLTIDPQGNLWVISKGDDSNKPRILRYSPTGAKLAQEITGLPDPRGLAVDSKGRLVVGVNGNRQQVCFFSSIDTSPTLATTFGDVGGLMGGSAPGVVTPRKFLNITAVGADGSGNFYVAFTGHDTDVGAGTVLRSFNSSGAMNWEVLGLEFVDVAAVDPFSDGTDVYTKQEHFTMDYSKPAGKEWTWKGYTLDSATYPGDWRDQRYHHMYAWEMRRVSGKKFLYTTDMDFGHLGVVRFANDSGSNDELAIPCANLSEGSGIWIDRNGDGKQDASEYVNPFEPNHKMHGKFVDENGGLWIAVEFQTIYYIPCDGVDRNGVPMYDLAGKRSWSVAADFTVLGRVAYVASTDTLYVGGFTTDHPVSGNYGGFQVIKKYQGLLATGKLPVPQWAIIASDNSLGKSMYADEQYVFFCKVRDPGHVKCFSAADGSHVQTLAAGPEVGSTQGWVDIGNGLNAFRRSNGEYLVFQEEDAFAKVLMYRWQAPRPNTPAPAAPSGLTAGANASGKVTLAWTDNSNNEWGFKVERRTGDGGNYVQVGIARGNSGTYICKDLLPGTSHAFRVRAYNSTGGSAYTNETTATTLAEPTVVLTAPSNNQAFSGPATVTITAKASAPGGTVSKVEFFLGTIKLGEDSAAPYEHVWANARPGYHLITAKVTGSNGDTAASAPVGITITGDQILGGSMFGDPGWQNAEHTKKENNWNPGPEAAFDGDINSFANGGHSGTTFGIDLGENNEAAIGKIRYYPRPSVPGRANGGEFQGSGDGTHYTTLATIPGNTSAQWYEVTANNPTKAYRYLRYVAPNGSYGNIAEIEFHSKLTDVNQAPSCSLTSPTTGTIHPYGTIIRLAASAADRDGAISKVEFHDGDLHMGEDTTPPYTLDLSNMSAGSHTLTVRAYDNHGSVAVSKAVSIIVRKASSLH